MRVNVVLADQGQQDPLNKIHLLGAGWAATTLTPQGMVPDQAVAVFIEVPWDRCNRPITFALELLNEDGSPVELPFGPPPAEPQALRLAQDIIAVPPPGAPNGTPGNARVFLSLNGGLPLAPGRRYVWRATLDGQTREEWEAGFFVLRQQQPPQFGPAHPGPA